ncbi:carboxymuconolactone decarboxylase family protein [Streptomyces sp. NPDC057199]|uniref:carboxymuconolactone decarboxylase family protein n=1 Tax=Streptomyces sp. NPDC057199 TaxID=3346047 RepID=UPI00362FC878
MEVPAAKEAVSTLAVTDPELIAYFDNFAFDQVLRHTGDLDECTRLMTQLAAMIAVGAVSEYRVVLGSALSVGVTPVRVKEIVYQAVPYAGMARVFDFLHATNMFPPTVAWNCPWKASPPPVRTPGWSRAWQRRGRQSRGFSVCKSGSSARRPWTPCTRTRPPTRSTSRNC